MTYHLPAWVFLIPFVTAISIPLVALKGEQRCRPLALAALCVTAGVALISLVSVLAGGEIRYAFSGWAPPVGIEWVADEVASIMVAVACLLALICVLYSSPLPAGPLEGRRVPYYTIVLLLVSGLVGVIYAGDLFNIFVFLEIVALAGYSLVAVPGGRALMSAFRYLLMGSLGAAFYLLGVAYFYAATGTLNIADLAQRAPGLLESKAVIGGLIFMFIGLGIKMALMPLHAWLPDAYADAPDTAAPILAGLLTKVTLLVWVRILFWVIGSGESVRQVDVFAMVWALGVLASVGGSVLALIQTDLKKIFAYGGIAHVGLVLIGVGQGSHTGLTGGLFYLLNDAVMQCTLFMLAGILAHQYAARTLDDLERMNISSPWVLGAFVVAALSMVGLPPTGGFFGKWYIVLSAVESGNYLAVAAVIVTTLVTLAYFARVLERLFRGARKAPLVPDVETPLSFRTAVAVLSVAIMGLGLWSDRVVNVLLDATRGLGR